MMFQCYLVAIVNDNLLFNNANFVNEIGVTKFPCYEPTPPSNFDGYEPTPTLVMSRPQEY